MVMTARFAPKTEDALVSLLLARRDRVARGAETLRSETTEALSERDRSDLFDDEGPTSDLDAATALTLVQRAERRLWEFDEALARVARGIYGYCVGCGAPIPIERLRALPTTAKCVGCSRSSHRISRLVSGETFRSRQILSKPKVASVAGSGR